MPVIGRPLWKNLPRVAGPLRVEDPTDPLQSLQLRRGEYQGHVLSLVGSHPVFAGDGPSHCNAGCHDLQGGLFHPTSLLRIPPVVNQVRVEVSIPGVES
jgi:hypothetical protein